MFCVSANSVDKPFSVQRMITDFRGIVSNGTLTICYGNWGIMTYSTNAGRSWEQRSFGNNYNIMKIESDGSEFFGVTGSFLFRSYNNVSYWLKRTVSERAKILDMYNIEARVLDTVDLIKEFDCSECIKVSGIKIFDGKVYAQISYKAADSIYYFILVYSDNNGKSWKKLTQPIANSNCYKVINNVIYYLRLGKMTESSHTDYFVNEYFKIDSSHFEIDSSCFTQLILTILLFKDILLKVQQTIYYTVILWLGKIQ